MKIRAEGAEFHSDERTDMTKLIVAFRNFGNSPNKIGKVRCVLGVFMFELHACALQRF